MVFELFFLTMLFVEDLQIHHLNWNILDFNIECVFLKDSLTIVNEDPVSTKDFTFTPSITTSIKDDNSWHESQICTMYMYVTVNYRNGSPPPPTVKHTWSVSLWRPTLLLWFFEHRQEFWTVCQH